jgi:hypothetical protein
MKSHEKQHLETAAFASYPPGTMGTGGWFVKNSEDLKHLSPHDLHSEGSWSVDWEWNQFCRYLDFLGLSIIEWWVKFDEECLGIFVQSFWSWFLLQQWYIQFQAFRLRVARQSFSCEEILINRNRGLTLTICSHAHYDDVLEEETPLSQVTWNV